MNKNTENSNLFIKKLNQNKGIKLIPLKTKSTSLNFTKHFPSTVREWYNSIYTYSSAYKSLFLLSNNLTTLIKGYFYMYYNNNNILDLDNKSKRLKRLSLKRIFISKMELKHTNDKLGITIYVYNEEKRILVNKLLRLIAFILNTNKKKSDISPVSIINKLYLLNDKKKDLSLLYFLNKVRNRNILNLNHEQKKLNINNNIDNSIKDLNKTLHDLHLLNNIILFCKFKDNHLKKYQDIFMELVSKTYLEKEIKLLNYYKKLIILNKNKFKYYFLSKLEILISRIYGKQVEFNIVNQKSAHLNSDIFTQAVLIKLRKRKNGLLKTLKNFVKTARIFKTNKLSKPNAFFDSLPFYRVNKKIITLKEVSEDNLNNLLINILPLKRNKEVNNLKRIDTQILDSLKYKGAAGIRLEAKGRLTKRFTASRSVFKVKWKGSIKNIDSSYKGFSSVMLRGHLNSNIQYTALSSTTRNGAFGLKGWMSGS